MKNEEAIERFSVAVTATLYEEEQDLYRTAIKALEKQVPKKPREMRIGDVYCSIVCKCGYSVDDYFMYCPECGQALDWSE